MTDGENMQMVLAPGDKVEFADAPGDEYTIHTVDAVTGVFIRAMEDKLHIRVFVVQFGALFIPPPMDWSPERRREGARLLRDNYGFEEVEEGDLLDAVVKGAVKFLQILVVQGVLPAYQLAFSKVNGNDFGGGVAHVMEEAKTVTAAQFAAENN